MIGWGVDLGCITYQTNVHWSCISGSIVSFTAEPSSTILSLRLWEKRTSQSYTRKRKGLRMVKKRKIRVRFVQQLLLHFNLKHYSLSSRELKNVKDHSWDFELSVSERNEVSKKIKNSHNCSLFPSLIWLSGIIYNFLVIKLSQ